MSEVVKCPGCAVRHVFGAHTFTVGDQVWHCACLLTARQAEIEVMRPKYDAFRAACLRVCREADWCPICEHNPSSGHHPSCALVREARTVPGGEA